MIKIISANDFRQKDYHKRKSVTPEISQQVTKILFDVKTKGDDAVRDYELKFDGVKLSSLEFTEDEKRKLIQTVSNETSGILERAAENIREFHKKQIRNGFAFSQKNGVILGQKVSPLKRVGVYVPGGTASYPSTVLMNVIPAKIAGVPEIMIATPPSAKPEIIAAAKIAGADRVFRMGGVQAIGAFAYGTQSVPKADKITGPGNIYVAEAKRQVFGEAGIDMVAGPSEILIIADGNNNPAHLAADLLAQAEHDALASAILITTSENLAQNVRDEIERQILTLPRHDTARTSIDNNGAVILVSSLDEAVRISDEIAPEHLELCTENPFDLLHSINNAGSIFLGKYSPEALGDYYAGANHTLPTMGTAKFASPLSVDDFIKKTQYIYYSHEALLNASSDIENFARLEGLTAHAESISVRRG